jgi:hypothetical protein
MKRILMSILLVAFIISPIIPQVKVEKTVPEQVELSDIREFVINVSTLTIDIHLENGKSCTLTRQLFLNFWNNTMTAPQRVVVRSFIMQLAALAADVDLSKVTGTFGE